MLLVLQQLQDWERSKHLQDTLAVNLRRSEPKTDNDDDTDDIADDDIDDAGSSSRGSGSNGKWLGTYRPMSPQCPLVGRKVDRDAVSDLLERAWRCDGLGYAWSCVEGLSLEHRAVKRILTDDRLVFSHIPDSP